MRLRHTTMKLSKSTYIRGKSCAKSTYLSRQFPDINSKVPPSLESKFLNGNEVGKLARELFEGGIDISQGGKYYGESLLLPTLQAIQEGHTILYEAAFETDGTLLKYFNETAYNDRLFFTADIVVICQNKIKVYEVKSSTRLKEPIHVYELGFQSLVIRNNPVLKRLGHGDKKIEFYFVYLNKEYKRGNELNIDELFTIDNVTRRCLDVELLVLEDLTEFKNSFSLTKEPKERKGAHCYSDKICPFFNSCWKSDVKDTILSLGELSSSTLKRLAKSKVFTLSKLTEKNEELTYKQWATLESNLSGNIIKNKKELGTFTKNLNTEFYQHFINFNSYSPGIPKYIGMSPYQAIPFQLCTLSRKALGSTIERTDFMEMPGNDPRINFINAFLLTTQQSGTIFHFDKGIRLKKKDTDLYYPKTAILNKLAEQYPQYAADLRERISRMMNLAVPFERRWYYDPKQLGNDDWRTIAKIFLDRINISNLPYGNSEIASLNYIRYNNLDLKNQILTKRALPEYCFYDTFALINIIDRFCQEFDLRKAA